MEAQGQGRGTEVLRCEQRLCNELESGGNGLYKVQDWGFSCKDNWKAQIGQFDTKQGCDGRVFSFFLRKGTLAMRRMTSSGQEAPEFQVLSKLRLSSMKPGWPPDQSVNSYSLHDSGIF